MTMLLKTSPGSPQSVETFVTGASSQLDRFRMSAKPSSTRSFPSLKTSTNLSFAGSPLPSVTVVHFPSSHSKVKRPFLDFLPGSVIGSFTTSTPTPFTHTYEHLNAHFCVSRCSFCSSAPPLPKARLSAAQPASVIAIKIMSKDLMSMPSPWITRMQGGNSLWPVEVMLDPNLPSNFSSTSSTMPGSSPLSGRTTKTPSRASIIALSSVPQYFSHAW
mmetsp:Transcript_104622/g.300780  ORF Transcript_104622/g.300780 Transcript_104622/m.300780 type:complete len:217 (-) Transcript_104622:582-1232(-)